MIQISQLKREKEEMKKALKEALFMLLLAAATVSFALYATSAEVWYAGEHTASCNGADNCDCTAELVKLEVSK